MRTRRPTVLPLSRLRVAVILLLLPLLLSGPAWASAYDARPKLVIIIIADQFRGDYLERAHDQLGDNGFRLLMERGAYFTGCDYDYANTRTAPGHATLLTGAYSNGHGILANEWWDAARKRAVTSVEDDSVRLVGPGGDQPGVSPHNLQADTLGDELKLATQGKSRVFALSLKDRAAVLPGGFAADAAYWMEHDTGAWISSSYYMKELPVWVKDFNAGGRANKYWSLEWKDKEGHVLRSTARPAQRPSGGWFYAVVGSTPFANDYELEFARELILNEKLGSGPTTDLLIINLAANDILGHKVGPDSPETAAMVLAMDRQLEDFFGFLGRQIGLANIWLVMSADHGIAPTAAYANSLRIPARRYPERELQKQVNEGLNARFSPGKRTEYVPLMDWPQIFLDENAFSAAKVGEADAERATGEVLKQLGARAYYTRAQLAAGEVAPDELGHKYAHSYSPLGGWYVLAVPAPFDISTTTDPATHGAPYTYDTHVPLAFFGLPFKPGIYRTHCEPVDLAPTLASLLGINAPTSAVGRVLTEALPQRAREGQP